MYSYEERMRAVALYIQLGKRPGATIRELGYPSRNALKGWYLEYMRRQDLPACSARRPPKFTEAQKQAALDHYTSHGRCVSWAMQALGYPGRAMLTAWVREAFPEIRTVSSGGAWSWSSLRGGKESCRGRPLLPHGKCGGFGEKGRSKPRNALRLEEPASWRGGPCHDETQDKAPPGS